MNEGRLLNEKNVVSATVVLSLIAIYFSYTNDLIVAYNDAAAHLNTARRMVDSLTPGVVQVGSVWLPLLHLFELPFASSFYLWKTGLAGSIVSGLSFVIASFFLYKLLLFVSDSKLSAVIAILAFVTNINLLYLQTTAMFEPLLMATALGAVFFLTRWARDGQVSPTTFRSIFYYAFHPDSL